MTKQTALLGKDRSESPLNLIGTAIAAASAGFAAYGLLQTSKTYSEGRRVDYVNTISSLYKELEDLELASELYKNPQKDRIDNYDLYSRRYFNVLERLAYLAINDYVRRNIIEEKFSRSLNILDD